MRLLLTWYSNSQIIVPVVAISSAARLAEAFEKLLSFLSTYLAIQINQDGSKSSG